MAIKAKFAEGATSATTKSLFQWDYGQKLEIEAADLPATFEVHFSCQGMTEAAVVPCSTSDGVAVVAIPDGCLEQSAQITAWVYEIEGASGTTTKVITIPVVSRTRPSTGDEIPASAVDKYTELITAVNAALAALKDGSVTVAKAASATSADYATSAGNASSAANATTANSAVTANVAVTAKMCYEATYASALCRGVYRQSYMDTMATEVDVPYEGWYMVLVQNGENQMIPYVMCVSKKASAVLSPDEALVSNATLKKIVIYDTDKYLRICDVILLFNEEVSEEG